MSNEQKRQSIQERIIALQEALPIALKERRRRFLEACFYYSLALDGEEEDESGLNEKDRAALDRALDLFTSASTMVVEIRSEIKSKQDVREVAAKRGIAL